jgi:hypothetical protein
VLKKSGRPFSENKRSNRIEVKLNADEIEKLTYCIQVTKRSRAKIIREGIDVVYERLIHDSKT